MAYVSLYRKYRPQTFAEVVGQDHVTRSLINAIREDRLHHAYLFTGPRGTGKTSTARILAKSINCVEGPTPEPCNACEQCVAITSGSSVDVIEMDMASHGGVDDARELRDRALFAPASARRKVYILDEVHMASTAAFNALLKLIEEPPAHVVFAMATTDPQKVLPTIMSRVQRLDLRRVGAAEVAARVRDLVTREGHEIDDAAVDAVVRAGDGSVRDTESVLEQVLSYADGMVTGEDVAAVLGQTPFERTAAVVDAVAGGGLVGAFDEVQSLLDNGADLRQFTLDLVGHVRDLLVLVVAPGREDLVDATDERRHALVEQASALDRDLLGGMVDDLGAALAEMRQGGPVRLALELALARAALRNAGRASSGTRPRRGESADDDEAPGGAGPAAAAAPVDDASPDAPDAPVDADVPDQVEAPDAEPPDDLVDADQPGEDEPRGTGDAGEGAVRDGVAPVDDRVPAGEAADGPVADGSVAEASDADGDDGEPPSPDAGGADGEAGKVGAGEVDGLAPEDEPDDPATVVDAEAGAGDMDPEQGGDADAARDGREGDEAGEDAASTAAAEDDLATRAAARAERAAREGVPAPPDDRPKGPEVHLEVPPDRDETADLEAIRTRWEAVLELVKVDSRRYHAMLEPATPTRLRNRILTLAFPARNRFHAQSTGQQEVMDSVVAAVEGACGVKVRIDVHVEGDEPPRPRPRPVDDAVDDPDDDPGASDEVAGAAERPSAATSTGAAPASTPNGASSPTTATADPEPAGEAVGANPLAGLSPTEAMDRAAGAITEHLGAREIDLDET